MKIRLSSLHQYCFANSKLTWPELPKQASTPLMRLKLASELTENKQKQLEKHRKVPTSNSTHKCLKGACFQDTMVRGRALAECNQLNIFKCLV